MTRIGVGATIGVALVLLVVFQVARRQPPPDAASRLAPVKGLASDDEAVREQLEAIDRLRAQGERVREIESRLSLGETYERVGDVDSALGQYQHATNASREIADALLVARSANRLAAIRHRLGDVDSAKALATEALAAARLVSSEAEEAQALFHLGLSDYSLGSMRAALPSFERSAEAAERGGDLVLESRARLHVGIAATMMEQKARAETALTRAVELSRQAGDPGSESEALRTLGQLYSRLGDTQRAIENIERARKLLEPLGDPGNEAILQNALGQIYFDLGETETALRHYRSALELNETLKFRRREAATLLEVGRCELDLGRNRRALDAFTRALAVYRSLHNRRLEADVLAELGRFHERNGDHATAIRYFDEALDLKLETGDSRGRAHTLVEAGNVRAKLGSHDTALELYREAAELSGADDDPLGESLALYHAAREQGVLGRLMESRRSIERSLELVETLRARVASHGLRTSFFASVHDRYSFYVDLLLRLHQTSPHDGFDALAFQVAERARARTLLESLGEAAAGIRQGIDPELLAEERKLRDRLNDAARERSLLPSHADPETVRTLTGEVAAIASDYDRLQSTIRTTSPRYSSLTQPEAMSLAEVQRELLDDDTRLLAYTLGAERSFLWSVTRKRHRLYVLPPGTEIESLARGAVSHLRLPHRVEESVSEIERLSHALVAPVEDLSDSKRLLIVGDGALNRLPFAALVDGNGTRLIETHEIIRLPSASIVPVLGSQRRGRRFTKWAAIAADPAYEGGDARLDPSDRSRAPSLALKVPRLVSSRTEALEIQALAPAGTVDVVLGFDASREWVTSTDFREYRGLHFATHGVADDGEPALSGIVLSLVDERGESRDGFLRLHDVYNLNLPVDLVVLSACETGLGKEVRGEGLLGLVRGFLYAGAAAVVASAWKVDDRATTELMKHFYRSYFNGATPSAALREAQVALLETKRFAAPYYWAAFELQGDWR